MRTSLTPEQVNTVGLLLKTNHDLFAWAASNMPGIHPSVMSHKLAIFKDARSMAQNKRRMGEEKHKVVEVVVRKLLEA